MSAICRSKIASFSDSDKPNVNKKIPVYISATSHWSTIIWKSYQPHKWSDSKPECFSIECCKTRTKLNYNGQLSDRWTKVNILLINSLPLLTNSWYIFWVLFLIIWFPSCVCWSLRASICSAAFEKSHTNHSPRKTEWLNSLRRKVLVFVSQIFSNIAV